MILLNDHKITKTVFPDRTSQVWQIPEEHIHKSYNDVVWFFESEDELISLHQLSYILTRDDSCKNILHVPFLPYARQDKYGYNLNTVTFALRTFAQHLNFMRWNKVITLDVHNPGTKDLITNFINVPPYLLGPMLLDYDTVIFPDKGAYTRYSWLLHNAMRSTIATKQRDQATGKITSYHIEPKEINGRCLVVDDLCDGGATFNILAESLKEKKTMPQVLDLYVTHGIFSKGFDTLLSNYNHIYTTDSLISYTHYINSRDGAKQSLWYQQLQKNINCGLVNVINSLWF